MFSSDNSDDNKSLFEKKIKTKIIKIINYELLIFRNYISIKLNNKIKCYYEIKSSTAQKLLI